jgi:hypothetical protein
MKGSRVVACTLAGVAAVAAAAQLIDALALRSPASPAAPSGVASPAADGRQPAAADLASQLRREPLSQPNRELFALPASAGVPAQAKIASVPASPVAPSRPPFPYRYAGRLDDTAGLIELYLVRGDGRLQPVKPGTVLGSWRIDRVTRESIDVTYLPDDARQSIVLASIAGEPERSSATRVADAEESELARRVDRELARAIRSDSTQSSPPVARGASIAGVRGTSSGVGVNPSAGAGRTDARGSSSIASGALPAGGTLGEAAPAQGSMLAGAAGGSANSPIRTGSTPSGKLGDAVPSGRLGE